MLPSYPELAPIDLNMRAELHPWFQRLEAGLSEFTFSNIWLFRHTYHYEICRFDEGKYLLVGTKNGQTFFSAPWGLPPRSVVDEMFRRCSYFKNLNEQQKQEWEQTLAEWGYSVVEDRDNWDYLYDSHEMATLEGKRFHKKRNHVHHFQSLYPEGFVGQELTSSEEHTNAALRLLDSWQASREDKSDYLPSQDAILHRDELELKGRIWTLHGEPVGFAQGEPTGGGTTFSIHFEKADGQYKGVYQTIFMDWARELQSEYKLINREQDLGDPGLRQAKETYRPVDYVKKYRVVPTSA